MTRVSKQSVTQAPKADFEPNASGTGTFSTDDVMNQLPFEDRDVFNLVQPNVLDGFLGQSGQGLAASLGLNMTEVSDGVTEETFDAETLALLDQHGGLLERSPSDSLSAGEADILIQAFLARQS